MEVKGTAVEILPKFVAARFGDEAVKKWIDSLSPNAKKEFSGSIFSFKWYPVKEMLVEPTLKVCELFYKNDLSGAYDIGEYSAEYALKGIYKAFVKFGSPEFLIKKASTIMSNYYHPSTMEVVEMKKGESTLRITRFEDMHQTIELRIKGWMIKALEISGAKNTKVDITKSLAKNDPYTDFVISWG